MNAREPMKCGQRYKIRNRTLGGEDIIEGEAVLVARMNFKHPFKEGGEDWLVAFVDDEDKSHFMRFVRYEDRIS